MTAVCSSVTVATASSSSAAAVTVSAMVVVSPWSAPCTVTTHDLAGLQVDRVLGFVGEMGPPAVHFRDARVGVMRMPLLGVAAFLGAVAFPSSVVASIPMVVPLMSSAVASTCRIQGDIGKCCV